MSKAAGCVPLALVSCFSKGLHVNCPFSIDDCNVFALRTFTRHFNGSMPYVNRREVCKVTKELLQPDTLEKENCLLIKSKFGESRKFDQTIASIVLVIDLCIIDVS